MKTVKKNLNRQTIFQIVCLSQNTIFGKLYEKNNSLVHPLFNPMRLESYTFWNESKKNYIYIVNLKKQMFSRNS